MSSLLRRNVFTMIAGVVISFLIGMVVFQMSHPAADPIPTQIPTPTLTDIPRPTQTSTLLPIPSERPTGTFKLLPVPAKTCLPTQDQVQADLQAAIPKYFWGVHYQVASFPELYFFGVNTGETKTTTLAEPSGDSWNLDLARLYYLHEDGTLGILWATLGFSLNARAPSTPAPYNTFNDMGAEGWFSSQDALAQLSEPGHIFYLAFPEKFIERSGIHWDQCRATVRIIPKAACNLGPILDPSGSAQFFSSGIPPEDWIAFGFYMTPNNRNAYLQPIPNMVTFPEAVCP